MQVHRVLVHYSVSDVRMGSDKLGQQSSRCHYSDSAQPFIVITADPYSGTNVTFTIVPNGGAGGTFVGGGTSVVVTTIAGGVATSPQLTANNAAGSSRDRLRHRGHTGDV